MHSKKRGAVLVLAPVRDGTSEVTTREDASTLLALAASSPRRTEPHGIASTRLRARAYSPLYSKPLRIGFRSRRKFPLSEGPVGILAARVSSVEKWRGVRGVVADSFFDF